MDIWDYFEQRRRKCEERSLVPMGGWADVFSEHEGSAGKVGLMLGRFMLREGAYLKIMERHLWLWTGPGHSRPRRPHQP